MTLQEIRAALDTYPNEWDVADALLADVYSTPTPTTELPRRFAMRAMLAGLVAEMRLRMRLQSGMFITPAIDACPDDVIAAVEQGLMADALAGLSADTFATVESSVVIAAGNSDPDDDSDEADTPIVARGE